MSGIADGDEAFGTLSEKARKKILAYYAEQKPLKGRSQADIGVPSTRQGCERLKIPSAAWSGMF